MTETQKLAHERLIAALPARKVGDMNEPENWPERDRPLTPDELEYLESVKKGYRR